jgi:hypothetical protein
VDRYSLAQMFGLTSSSFAERFPSEYTFETAPNWNWYNEQVYQYQQQQLATSEPYPVDTFSERFDAIYSPGVNYLDLTYSWGWDGMNTHAAADGGRFDHLL